MFPYSVRNTNPNLGFSLIEMMVTLLVVGVLAAIGIPNFIQMRERFEANSAFDQARDAVKDAQLQAIRLSKNCTIKIDGTAKTIDYDKSTNTAKIINKGCLLKTITLPGSTSIKTNSTTNTISFTFQGNTGTTQTIVVSNKSQNYKKCLVISAGIGIMRWGEYTGVFNNRPDPKLCITQQ